ncbi:MAG: carboxypeptidase regulatory-like domain-containing protein [Thermoguttaceae bacterium]|nr:carboxypeptidase regulatory-like domain-containing protein [Thermoguttaceae bacterium]
MKKKLISLCSLFGLAMMVFLAVGCGNAKVTGTVKLEDGSSVANGRVVFETEDGSSSSVGAIENGQYTMGTKTEDDGVPPGKYIVYITSATKATGDTIEAYAGIDTETGEESTMTLSLLESVVAEEYTSAQTSPLRCEVKGSMKFDIVVPGSGASEPK